jgi:hypothetical protein
MRFCRFATVMLTLARAGKLDKPTFELDFLDSFVQLATDDVINVRIAVARGLAELCRLGLYLV